MSGFRSHSSPGSPPGVTNDTTVVSMLFQLTNFDEEEIPDIAADQKTACYLVTKPCGRSAAHAWRPAGHTAHEGVNQYALAPHMGTSVQMLETFMGRRPIVRWQLRPRAFTQLAQQYDPALNQPDGARTSQCKPPRYVW